MKKLIWKVYVFMTITATFVATVAPTVIRAADIAPQTGGKSTPAGTALLKAPVTVPALRVRVTAYSSSPDETDDTPFVTALGTRVRDGVVATNLLPFGTKIKIPSLFGEKIFTVEDRMNRRMKNVVDIWMPTKAAALKFGVNNASIVILRDEALSRR